MIVLAHAGHWLINLLYAAPILALIVLLVRDRIKHRSERDEEDLADGEPVE
jgi:hypothetical protein